MKSISLDLFCFESEFSDADDVVLYGSGELGELVFCFFEYLGLSSIVKKVVDKGFREKVSSRIKDFPVDDPKSIDPNKNQRIIICSFEYEKQIKEFLLESLGVKEGDVFSLDFPADVSYSGHHSDSWIKGAGSEIYFWTKSLATRNYIERACTSRAEADKPFCETLLTLLDYKKGKEVNVLDVGSGPVTVLGYTSNDYDINLVCVDPLANEYKKLYSQFKFHVPVEPIACSGEDIVDQFEGRLFDITHSCNALDHSSDPLRILKNMCSLLIEGGICYVVVHENEAEHAGYDGLHQWNFTIENEEVVLWNKSHRYSIDYELSSFGKVTAFRDPMRDGEIVFYLRK